MVGEVDTRIAEAVVEQNRFPQKRRKILEIGVRAKRRTSVDIFRVEIINILDIWIGRASRCSGVEHRGVEGRGRTGGLTARARPPRRPNI